MLWRERGMVKGGEEEEDEEKLEGGMEKRKGGGCYTVKRWAEMLK